MRNDGELCDVTIIVQSQEFRCHKVVLAAFSRSFQSLFTAISGKPRLSGNLNVRLDNKNLTASAFAHLLDYLYTCRIQLTKENATEVQHAARFLNIKGVAEACTELLQNSETMTGRHTTETGETDALASGSENSTKTPVSTSSDDMVHKKETLQGSATCEVTDKESDMFEAAADSSQHASQSITKVDTESEKLSTCEKVSCTPISNTFVSASTMQGSSLHDSNASGCGNVETTVEAELPILSQWLQTSDVDKKTVINKEAYPSEGIPKEVIEKDLNQLLLEKLETELGGIPTIEDLDEDPIVWDPMGWIQDDPDCLEGERSEVRSKASSGAHCDDDEGFRRKRKLSGEMFPWTKRSKMDVQTASAHTLSDDSSEGCAKKKDPVLYSMLKDTFDVTELETPKMKMPASECSTLPAAGRDQSKNGDCDNVVQTKPQLESKTSTNKALETKIDSSPANLHPFSMSENSLAESRKPRYPLARKDPERYKIPSNPNSRDQQKTFFGDFTAIRDTSQHGDVPLNIPTNTKLRGVCEKNGTGAVPYSQNAQLRTVHNPAIVDRPRSVLSSFGKRVVARDLFSTKPSVPQLQNLQFKTVHHPSIFTGSGERVVSQDSHNPTVPHSQNLQYKTVHNPGIVDKLRSVSPSFGDNVVAQDLCVSKPTVSHSQNMQFKTVHNPEIVDKPRSVFLPFGERVVARDLFSTMPSVPQSQNLQFKTAHDPSIVDQPGSIFTGYQGRVITQDIQISNPTMPRLQNLQYKTVHNPELLEHGPIRGDVAIQSKVLNFIRVR
ncbi:PREDICTED: uncharacterized protein LOC109481781 [Branchiostoma belcheri]|uniref:Uncharacterized protein LOC109481781 n=1 Tax=Branchiostoma belcheri TaxID=7741 RepID=A0A6P5ADT0_BRABE|nr:PREDICTED: uncharacterized protein LOC109481781 [Branchiostoma belcheri]